MSELPLVLAGPIVRRVEATACSFWIALSKAAKATVTLWQNSQMAGSSAQAFAVSKATDLTKIGEQLFVGVVTVSLGENGRSSLLPGALYAYDVSFTGSFGSSDLKQAGLLEDELTTRIVGVAAAAPRHKALGYVKDRLPAFVAPAASAEQLRIAHASCRKPNGPGLDALAWLDDEIERSLDNADGERVQQLFLTGDQIYADDLGASLLPMLNVLGQDLMGRAERLPVGGSDTFAATIENFPALRRGKLVRGTARFTSGASKNHLMTFGEFAAMYLAVWSPRVWRSLASNNELFVPPPDDDKLKAVLTDLESCYGDEPSDKRKAAQQKSVDEERGRVIAFRDSVARVARALANVSTYMIFDDHEITDDWSLHKQWRNRVFSNPLGKAIVRNGMMAYGLFQGWGNDPAEFAKSGSTNQKFLIETQKVLGAKPNNSGPLPVGSADLLDQLVGSTEDDNKKRAKWNYLVPGPSHMVCVLDTRTRRKFKGEGLGPPNLLGDSLNDQVPKKPLADGRELLLVVSAVPVLAPMLIEQLGAPLFEIIADAQYGWKKVQNKADDPCHPFSAQPGVSAADAESWSADEVARENFLKKLAIHDKVLVLSGDVHYGLTMRMDYWRDASTRSVPIVQLTSSPACNSFQSVVESLVRSNAQLQQYMEGGRSPELLGWNSAEPFTIPNGTTISPGRRSRLRRSPALLPTRGWPAETTVEVSKPPDWRWRIQLVSDIRPERDLPIDTPRLPALVGSDTGTDTDHFARYTAIATRHQTTAVEDKFFLLRRIVFTPNIGLVSLLRQDDGELAVQHTLLSKAQVPSEKGQANTQHVVVLAPTSEGRPSLTTD